MRQPARVEPMWQARDERGVRVAIWFHPEVFELIRKRAEREATSFGEVVTEIIEKDLGA